MGEKDTFYTQNVQKKNVSLRVSIELETLWSRVRCCYHYSVTLCVRATAFFPSSKTTDEYNVEHRTISETTDEYNVEHRTIYNIGIYTHLWN